jgi:uncharacterized membrane protein
MKINRKGNFTAPLIYLIVITALSVIMIGLNAALGMIIPFRVEFLIGFIGLLGIFCVWHAVISMGWKKSTIFFLSSYLIAFFAEVLGVNFGLIFGEYHYTQVLGVKLLGVPLLAATAWEPIIYAAYGLSYILMPSSNHKSLVLVRSIFWGLCTAGIAALATTAWDLMIDPIAVSEGWWIWHGGGAYMENIQNGVPIQNFIGWLGVSLSINLVHQVFNLRPLDQSNNRFYSIGYIALYSALFLTASGVSLTILQRPDIALIGMMSMLPLLIIAYFQVISMKSK